jgi:hypothetical protein
MHTAEEGCNIFSRGVALMLANWSLPQAIASLNR